MKIAFYVFSVALVEGAFVVTTQFGMRGSVWVLLIPIVLSPVCMCLVRVIWESNQPRGMFNPATQSWAFLFGDTIALPMAFGFSAVAWRSIESGSWFRSDGWMIISVFAGVAIALAWHFLLDGPGYRASGHADLLGSPSKLWHDFVVYGALSGGLVFLGVPALVKDFNGVGWLTLGSVLLWAVLGVVGDNVFRQLDPAKLHPPVQDTALA